MGPLLIIFHHPPIGCLSDLVQITEQVEIKEFIPVRPVKAFNVSVLIRCPGLNVLDRHADMAMENRALKDLIEKKL